MAIGAVTGIVLGQLLIGPILGLIGFSAVGPVAGKEQFSLHDSNTLDIDFLFLFTTIIFRY